MDGERPIEHRVEPSIPRISNMSSVASRIRSSRWAIVAAGVIVVAATTRPVRAETARAILDEARTANDARAPKDVSQKMKMTIFDSGAERIRDMEMYAIDPTKRDSKTLMFFQSPPEVHGVGFLAWSYPDKEDDQWLYLPELKRVRQITANIRQQSFQGSDFSYQDLALYSDVLNWSEKEASSVLVEQGAMADGVSCAVVELHPADEDLAYGKLVLWLNRADATVRKIDFYDRADGNRVKMLVIGDYRTIDNIPTPHRFEMATLKKGTRTVLENSDVRYNQGLTSDDFTQRTLERGRLR